MFKKTKQLQWSGVLENQKTKQANSKKNKKQNMYLQILNFSEKVFIYSWDISPTS